MKGNKRLQSIGCILYGIGSLASPVCAQNASVAIQASCSNCVKVTVPFSKDVISTGSGFFVDPLHVVTCFHVVGVSNFAPDAKNLFWRAARFSTIHLSDGEDIRTELTASVPDISMQVAHDFIVLTLEHKPKQKIVPCPLSVGQKLPIVGSPVVFSGYPFGEPIMLTHKGYISGNGQLPPNGQVIAIEAPVNEGNSGGALLNERGEIIGIINFRNGGISQGLQQVLQQVQQQENQGSVAIMGINMLPLMDATIQTMNKYISPGIGYARPIQYLVTALRKSPMLLKENTDFTNKELIISSSPNIAPPVQTP